MLIDAIVLTGGRSSRLDSVPKSEFLFEGATLLSRTLDAATAARTIAVVGLEPSVALPERTMVVREEPPFGGPVAAIAAGLGALLVAEPPVATEGEVESSAVPEAEAVMILACDMPHAGLAVPTLLEALCTASEADGVIAIDGDGRRQPLAAVYRTQALKRALEQLSAGTQHGGAFDGIPVFRLLDHLQLLEVPVPHEATADVDTWADATRLGATPPATTAQSNEGVHHA